MTTTPEARTEYIEELAKAWAERLKDSLTNALSQGWLLFARGKPQQRLKAYMSQTYESDIPLVRDRQYMEKLNKGFAPMLLAVQLTQARAVLEGQLPAPPQLWPMVLLLPPYVFEALSSDMDSLLKEVAKQGEAV